jgi:pimeloyl-ACP methyl ester carboxylesterase
LFTRYRGCVPDFHVETIGSGPRVVLVHGSGNPATAWDAQRALADRFTLVLPIRSGYPPNPPLERIDFERQAEELAALLDGRAHLVGHSYGGVISMLLAAAEPERVRSLAVSEPPAFGVAGSDPAVEPLVEELRELFETSGPIDPAEHTRRFVRIVGVEMDVPDPLPPDLEAATRAAMAERPPWEAEIPFEPLRAAPFPKLVLSGGHHPAFDAVCDVLEERLGAQRAVVAGRGHGIPRAPGYNERLAAFLVGA